MLKREDLEEMARLVEPERLTSKEIERLGGAAPALALACLVADEYADMMERGEQVRMSETLQLRKLLRAVLSAAGVEVD